MYQNFVILAGLPYMLQVLRVFSCVDRILDVFNVSEGSLSLSLSPNKGTIILTDK